MQEIITKNAELVIVEYTSGGILIWERGGMETVCGTRIGSSVVICKKDGKGKTVKKTININQREENGRTVAVNVVDGDIVICTTFIDGCFAVNMYEVEIRNNVLVLYDALDQEYFVDESGRLEFFDEIIHKTAEGEKKWISVVLYRPDYTIMDKYGTKKNLRCVVYIPECFKKPVKAGMEKASEENSIKIAYTR